VPPTISDEDRKRLLAEVRALAGAPLQKVWLPSAQVCVLQLRVPGKNVLVVVDARLAMAAVAEERPTAPESAPRSQATLRAALLGARLSGARLEIAGDRRTPAARLEFGARALIADEALILVEGSRIIWASSGAGPARRPGSPYPEARELELGDSPPPAGRKELVRAALQREEEAGLAARRREVVARLKSRVQKLRRTLAAVEEDAARAARAKEDLHKAELLLPLRGRIKRGSREARVQDWSRADAQGRPAEVVIALDPASSAAETAARWLRQAKRYQAAGARISARREEVAADLARAGDLLSRASSAQTAAGLAEVEAALPAAPQRRRRAAPRERLPYRTFRSQSGAPILVGRSARDNDALTFKVARGNDVWLHARGLQGAHVVLPGAGEAPDSRALGDAALLAAHFSSARGEERAEVAWTRCKHVRKPRGAAPGAVTISQEKTLRVRKDEARLASLLRSEVEQPSAV
jgi:predicted ribosome quality control (RQC) complex YloA/Tae2 family protein